jgi:steroid 5-alpha reductase family enzyme
MKNGSISSRITFSGSLALFYAFLTTPVLYAMRNTAATNNISMVGAYLAWFGASLEAIADVHKLIVKQSNKDVKEFVGPTTWAYRICRHPNYLGEVLFWTGLFVGGVTSFGKSIPAWLGSSMGLLGIVSIMFKASASLEKRQQDKYEGQEKFDTWKAGVKYPLIPFVQ